MNFRLTDFGTATDVAVKLELSAIAASNVKPALEEIQADMLRVEGVIFSSQGRRGGGSWKRLREETIRKKGNTKLLYTAGSHDDYKELTGPDLLVKSMTKPDAKFQIMKTAKNWIVFGTDRPYAIVHQRGSIKRNIPRRQFMRFTPFDERRWANIIGRYVVAPARKR